ncbi:MAG: hypothetical protein ACQGVC_17480 [Myxococcota bacterium]
MRTPCRIVVLLLGSAWLAACAGPGAPPVRSPVREARLAPIVPDTADHAAADLAAAALVADVEGAARALDTIAAFDDAREAGPTGLEPAAVDLWNAASVPGRGWREASEEVLERDDLDPALRERIERALQDDPLERASDSVHDARMNAFARFFNTIVEPVGQSVLNTALAPYRIGRSLVRYGIYLYRRDPLPLERRQALAHWKDFLARYPDADEAAEVAKDVEKAQARWHQTMRKKALAGAEAALEGGRPREALVLADRALRHSPENERAEEIRQEAGERLLAIRADLARSVGFALPEGHELLPPGTRRSAIELLEGRAAAGSERPEMRFARAGVLDREGDELGSSRILHALADGDPDRENMVRHASAALADPLRNPWDTFVAARQRDRGRRALWLLVGPFADARAPRNVDGGLVLLLEAPRMAQTLLSLPLRLVQWPWASPLKSSKVTSIQARRYLKRHPEGVHTDVALDWLAGYERRRNNPLGELEIAEARDPNGDHAKLRERAAGQMLAVALREERTDLRRAMLAGVARRFPGTEAGDTAGRTVRAETDDRTPHRVRLSRGFLVENPEVAGVHGLDLDPVLLDDRGANSELHPQGIALVGGRVIEIAYLGASGDEDDPPDVRYLELDPEPFARLIARVEETSYRNALLDDEDGVRPDAQRDHLFERAKLGLTDDLDWRPTASADYSYRGMRERYGLVRRREPILPFDIVVQGSLADLSLGAFPRMRSAEEPDDALLYE